MNNNILLNKPKVKFETHLRKPPDFPFIIRQHKDHRKSTIGIHENLELLWILEGEGSVLYDGQRLRVGKGDIIVVNTYTIHQVVATELPLFCVIIDRKFCQYNGIDPGQLLFQRIIRNDGQLEQQFRQLMDTYTCQEDPFRNAAFKCGVLNVLLYLCRHYSTHRQEDLSNTPAMEHVRHAIGYMKANFSRKITMDQIAAQAGLSKFHFLREFKRITGRTPIHYLNAIRCEYARNLLESGNHSVKEVAFLCGFSNNSYFSSVFQRYTGLLPSQVHTGSNSREAE